MFERLRIYLETIEGLAYVKSMRCFFAQGFIRAVLWIAALCLAGYAATKVNQCPKGQTCVEAQKMKGNR